MTIHTRQTIEQDHGTIGAGSGDVCMNDNNRRFNKEIIIS